MSFLKKILRHLNNYIFAIPLLLLQLFFVIIPLFLLLYEGFAGDNFLKTIYWFVDSAFLIIMLRSLAYALLCVLFCFLIGYPVACFIALSSPVSQKILLFFVCVPFLSNFILHIASWTFLLEPNGFIASILHFIGFARKPAHFLYTHGAVLVGMVYCYLPFMVVPLYTSLEKLDYCLCEASYDLGASWWQTLHRIILPSTKQGIIAGVLLVFVPACGEFVIPELLGGDRFMYAGSLLSHLMLSSSLLQHASLCTLFFSCMLAGTSALLYIGINSLIDWRAK